MEMKPAIKSSLNYARNHWIDKLNHTRYQLKVYREQVAESEKCEVEYLAKIKEHNEVLGLSEDDLSSGNKVEPTAGKYFKSVR